MAATTHSVNYGIKKIGSGLEAGTWGDSTSQNFERITDILGRAVSLDVLSMPVGSTSASADGTTSAEWVTLDPADSGESAEAGSEGRSCAVEFTGAATAKITVKVRGATTSANVARSFVVWNNLSGGNDLDIECAGSTYTVKNGAFALILTKPTVSGGWSAGVHNLLKKLQIESATLEGSSAAITFTSDGTVTIPASSVNSFKVSDGTKNIVSIDTSADMISTTSPVTINSTSATSLAVNDGTGNIITVDASANRVDVGDATQSSDLKVFGDIIVSDQASTIQIIDENASALKISGGGQDYLTINTVGGSEKNTFGFVSEFPDIALTGTDGYINATTTQGSSGYGFRNSSGTMQFKNSGGSWLDVVQFLLATIVNASAPGGSTVSGNNRKLNFQLGTLRIVIDTINISTTFGSVVSTSIILTEMASTVYNVMCTYATTTDAATGPTFSYVSDESLRQIVVGAHNVPSGNTDLTYIAIGDA